MANGKARTRRLRAIALCALFGAVCAAINTGMLGGFPPRPKHSDLVVAAAMSQIMVDNGAPKPPIVRMKTLPQHLQTLIKHTELLGRIVVTPPVLEKVATRCDIPPDQLSGLARTTAYVPLALTEPDSERRASEIEASRAPYRMEVQGRQTTPVLDVYTEAPSSAAAECVANAAMPALEEYLVAVGHDRGIALSGLVTMSQLGPARGGVANGRAVVIIGFLTFWTAFAICAVGLLAVRRLRERRQPAGLRLVLVEPRGWWAGRDADDERPRAADSWPHTMRLMPWMLAGFIALLWLTPFNDIRLNVTLPIELRLDRLVLPFVFIVWIIALAAGPRTAPRLRWTMIHTALAALVLIAFLSVVLDARYLNQTFEMELSIKKLPLVVSYVSLFVIAASSVRRSEVWPFLNYTLVLAVICALGMIYEYRFDVNVFWDWSDRLLPGFFVMDGKLPGNAVDHLGRRLVRGPAEAPLEAVAMLTMALPIAVVGLMQVKRWRGRILYGVAVCALVAATFATYRKSALIAPVSVIFTIAYFRRRELLRLAPLGMILLVVVSSLSPGALGSIVRQFTRSDATSVPTVNDRASDYDAVRPDVWTHLAFGRGWGSYNHDSYRILDSDILTRLIETGVLGLAAFLMVGVSVVLCTRNVIAGRDPTRAPAALVGASIAVGFIVLATLFDEMSFPHAPYIFLYMVGLAAAVLEPGRKRRLARADPPPVRVRVKEPEPEEVGAQATLVPMR